MKQQEQLQKIQKKLKLQNKIRSMARFIPKEAHLKKMGFCLVAGIDEVGRGPMAGPVVCAAVILKKGARIPGVDDSKKLSARKREELFDVIVENALDYAICFVSHKVIDDLNISGAIRFGNDQCLKCLKFVPDIALSDGHDKQITKFLFETVVKGDAKVRSIAAASILAKVARDKVMKYYAKEYNKYGFEKHVGYGTREHLSCMKKYGLCEIHRKTFTFKD